MDDASINLQYTVFEIDTTPNGGEMFQLLKSKTGSGSVPQIFLNKEYIGCFSDLKKAKEAGKLTNVPKKAPIAVVPPGAKFIVKP